MRDMRLSFQTTFGGRQMLARCPKRVTLARRRMSTSSNVENNKCFLMFTRKHPKQSRLLFVTPNAPPAVIQRILNVTAQLRHWYRIVTSLGQRGHRQLVFRIKNRLRKRTSHSPVLTRSELSGKSEAEELICSVQEEDSSLIHTADAELKERGTGGTV